MFLHESNPGQECTDSHLCPGLSRQSRSDTCAAWGMSRVQRRRQLRMMAKNQYEKVCRMASVSMTERSQGLHSGGSGLYKGRDASKLFPHCLYGRSESCSPDGRAPLCVSPDREAREKVNALAMSPKSCLHGATRQRTKCSVGPKSKCWTKPNNCSIIQYIGLALRTSGSSHGSQRSCPRALPRENRLDRRTTSRILLCVKFSSEVRPSVIDVRPGAPQ